MSEVLQTQEVGSLAKPNWRVAGVSPHETLSSPHIREACIWAADLGLDVGAALKKLNFVSIDQLQDHSAGADIVRDYAAEQAVRLQEKAGLDIIYDGEQDRSEMYEHSVRRTNGFESRGRIRVFDNKTFHKFAAVDEPSIDSPWHSKEVERLKTLTDRTIKVPLTGPYTIADWSYDEYFRENKRELLGALAENVIRPNISSILDQGVDWVQIDEPAAGTKKSEIPLFIESFNRSIAGLLGKFSIHLCYSKWQDFIPHIAGLENCHQLSIEFANRDSKELGTGQEDRPAYEVLKNIHRELPNTGIGLGVVSIHEDYIEPPELVRDRVIRAVELVGDPSLIYPSPDCGLRTRSWRVAFQKLTNVVLGTQLAKEELGV